MDNRFPYGSPPGGQPRRNPPVGNMTALELEEALYYQRRNEIQRDLQLRQMLLQDQLEQQQSVHHQRMFEIQQRFAGQQALERLHHDEQVLQEQLRRRQQLEQQLQHRPPVASPPRQTINAAVLAADSLAANATRRPPRRKRPYERTFVEPDQHTHKRQATRRKNSVSKEDSRASKDSKDADKANDVEDSSKPSKPKAKGKGARKKSSSLEQADENYQSDLIHDPQAMEAVEALMTADLNARIQKRAEAVEEPFVSKGTIDNLVDAADEDEKVDEAAELMTKLHDVEWSDSEQEDIEGLEEVSDENKISIILPGFKSVLPTLPIEPEYSAAASDGNDGKDKVEEKEQISEEKEDATPDLSAEVTENGSRFKVGGLISTTEYPYPVDTWWPSVSSIRRERRSNGENSDEDDFVEAPGLSSESTPFRANLRDIQVRLAGDVEPGVLEKIPHCKIHRSKIRAQKGATAPDHAFCWQVTESYCNDIIVCCSVCSTWRHASCGGHYKPASIRESIKNNTPFVPICDLCYQETSLVQNFPKGEARLERQRIEQLRRALATSAVIRQSSFIKHGGTYKWPLGSVSVSHVGGHTRSVLSRYDKAEKQWTEMTTRLDRSYGSRYRPKERNKVRTREFERLLLCIEDSESCMDRHNMMQFLQHDSAKEHPAGFDNQVRNLFDPDDDTAEDKESLADGSGARSIALEESDVDNSKDFVGRRPPAHPERDVEGDMDSQDEDWLPSTCARKGCSNKPRFDSIFCSDSCGVSTSEWDLYRAFEIAGELHPSLMRP